MNTITGGELEKGRHIIYRPMLESDVAAASEIEHAAFSMPWSADAFMDMVREAKNIFLVAQDGSSGEIVGICGILDMGGDGNITNVAVAEHYRNRGIGKRLVSEIIDYGRKKGMEAFTLEVRVSNAAAIHIYEKLGFECVGVRPGFYDRPKEDAGIYWLR